MTRKNTRLRSAYYRIRDAGIVRGVWLCFDDFNNDMGAQFEAAQNEYIDVAVKRYDDTKPHSKLNTFFGQGSRRNIGGESRYIKTPDVCRKIKMYEDYIMDSVERGEMTMREGKAEIAQNKLAKLWRVKDSNTVNTWVG